MERRIAAHRAQRPADWDTLEEPVDLIGALPAALAGYDTCLLDCLTLWVSNLLLSNEGSLDVQRDILATSDELIDVYEHSSSTWIIVSNEVGLGVVPTSSLGAAYRDALGRVNQVIAARADKVYFMVAGLALDLKNLGAVPHTSAELRLT
ncbi:Bifunctional adenosylcobalamin biosynthesis protein CobP [Geodia barretti]|uniref:Adenosylcobinamide kinase n=1 Tax=Geodia barretti TaxID=519541 RepID=A0AA35SE77_GEOBA|nr:Bifunctional adenosylcobalamin biosynthesis protein CobP [Geodia barretti]